MKTAQALLDVHGILQLQIYNPLTEYQPLNENESKPVLTKGHDKAKF